jgi:hypothetical protein
MNPHEYGIIPNVWRPSEVPPPFSGADTGVGAQPRPGSVTTTTTTEYGFPNAARGWVLVEQTGEVSVTAGGIVTTLSRTIGPAGYRQEWFVEWYGELGTTSGMSPSVICQAAFLLKDGTLAMFQQHVGHGHYSEPSFYWAGIHFRFPDTKSGSATVVGGGGLALAFVGGQPRIVGQAGPIDQTLDAIYGIVFVPSRLPFDATLMAIPPSAVPDIHRTAALRCRAYASSSNTVTVRWTRLWTRGGF